MEKCYREDIVLFFSIENLEEILNLLKTVRAVKGGSYKLLTLGSSNNLFFNSNDYLITKSRVEKEKKDDDLLLSTHEEEECPKNEMSDVNNMNRQGDEKEIKKTTSLLSSLNTNELKEGEEKKKKNGKNNHLFSEKYINDENELISREIFKYLYKNENNMKYTKKHKLLTQIIMDAIIYANKIKLNIYKLNLFISIVIMTLHKIMENLKGKKNNKKKKTVNYFISLLEKNIKYHEESVEKVRIANSAELDIPTVDSLNRECIEQNKRTTEDDKNMGEKIRSSIKGRSDKGRSNKDVGNKASRNSLPKETCVDEKNIKTKFVGETDNSNQHYNKYKNNNNLEDNNVHMTDINTENYDEKEIILLQYDEAKYIIKYMFDNIFSIYHMFEYLFLFSSFPVNLTFTNSFTAISPTHLFSTSDEVIQDKEKLEDNEFCSNTYIKEALDVPLYVLDKFYDNINKFKEKINDIVS
ncbi:conserved Plasmodium protein, unknown function [Plasmodium malariae]|uniref:Uncharacterized protein n=1 Tax=Plasmodium malariae TaxID=5858 RepID=A0A1D3RIJ1_PLAMA|nr:conserved Plasmodium protein, unknown function [Plasmodium malariae]SCN45014.1 conserved Plasmodium protein, unknown function [Plasmodium malariae]